jgi:beta-glucanase (GH16 family)
MAILGAVAATAGVPPNTALRLDNSSSSVKSSSIHLGSAPAQPAKRANGSRAVGVAGRWGAQEPFHGRRLVFHDGFNGRRLDKSKWSTCYPWALPSHHCTNTGNHGRYEEAECYTPRNLKVSHGHLAIVARRVTATCNGLTKRYTSGLIQSHTHFDFRYGYYAMRARVPSGRGMWPAFWSVPSITQWPPEIDAMEILSRRSRHPDHVSLTLHRVDGTTTSTNYFLPNGATFDSAYHVFGLDWRKRYVKWYIDGKLVSTARRGPRRSEYLIVNLALLSTDIANKFVPARMLVDYVRVWK